MELRCHNRANREIMGELVRREQVRQEQVRLNREDSADR